MVPWARCSEYQLSFRGGWIGRDASSLSVFSRCQYLKSLGVTDSLYVDVEAGLSIDAGVVSIDVSEKFHTITDNREYSVRPSENGQDLGYGRCMIQVRRARSRPALRVVVNLLLLMVITRQDIGLRLAKRLIETRASQTLLGLPPGIAGGVPGAKYLYHYSYRLKLRNLSHSCERLSLPHHFLVRCPPL